MLLWMRNRKVAHIKQHVAFWFSPFPSTHGVQSVTRQLNCRKLIQVPFLIFIHEIKSQELNFTSEIKRLCCIFLMWTQGVFWLLYCRINPVHEIYKLLRLVSTTGRPSGALCPLSWVFLTASYLLLRLGQTRWFFVLMSKDERSRKKWRKDKGLLIDPSSF